MRYFECGFKQLKQIIARQTMGLKPWNMVLNKEHTNTA
jgi:hypothetical protein